MIVPVVTIVDMRVLVLKRSGRMRVHMRLRPFPTLVFVLMVLVMNVAMRMHPRLVPVPM